MLLPIYAILGYIGCYLFELILTHDKLLNKKFWKHHIPIFGYHIHHSVYGLISIAIAAIYVFINPALVGFFLGFGWGIIIRHTVVERRFVFIEKMS